MASFFSIESDGGELGKPLKQVNIFDTYTDRDKDAELSKYLASRQEKIAKRVVDPEKFITSNKVVTLKEISNDKQKDHLAIQAYNDKNKNIILT